MRGTLHASKVDSHPQSIRVRGSMQSSQALRTVDCFHLLVSPPKAFPNFWTFFTSLNVKLTLVSLAARPPMNGVLSPSRLQLTIPSLPRFSSTSTSLIPCRHSVYRSPLVISKLLGSCSIRHAPVFVRLLFSFTSSTTWEPKLTVATTG